MSRPADGDIVVTGVGAVDAAGPASTLAERVAAHDAATGSEDAVHDALAALSKRERRRCDLASQIAVLAAREAIADAGWPGGVAPCPPERAGCVIGTFLGAAPDLHREYESYRRGKLMNALTSTWLFASMPTANVVMDHGFRGESFGVSMGMAGGAHAIGEATRLLRAGELDVAVAGGVDGRPGEAQLASLRAQGWLSPRDRAQPFERAGDGMALRSGGALLVLERADIAQRRGAAAYATLVGFASVSAAATWAVALEHALAAAAGGREVAFVAMQGTSLPALDEREDRAAAGERVPLACAPACVAGHTLGATGALAAVVAAQAARSGVAPRMGSLQEPLDDLTACYDGGRLRAGVALVSAYDPAGGAAALAFSRP